MTKSKNSHKDLVIKCFIGCVSVYTIIVLMLALINQSGLGQATLAVVGGWGAWVICYLFVTKRDIHYASWAAKYGEAPVARLIMLTLSIAWILLYPWSLIT